MNKKSQVEAQVKLKDTNDGSNTDNNHGGGVSLQ
jgi:hypothetical protein